MELTELRDLLKEHNGYFDEFLADHDGELISQTTDDGGRWTIWHNYILRFGDKFFRFSREDGAAETCEDSGTFRYLKEVFPKEVKVTKYLSKPDAKTLEWEKEW